jgi:hypothetical protein
LKIVESACEKQVTDITRNTSNAAGVFSFFIIKA